MYLCLFTLYHVSAFMFTKIIKKGHYHDCDNGLVFLWTGLFAQPLRSLNLIESFDIGIQRIKAA